MDDALLKAVEASRITLELFTDHGVGVKDSLVMVALDELERLEDDSCAPSSNRPITQAAASRASGRRCSTR
jgi:hypothetical protein